MTDPTEPIKLKVTAQQPQHEWVKKWGRGFPAGKIHKSRRKVEVAPPEDSQALSEVATQPAEFLPPARALGAWSHGSMSMLSRVSWLRWGELGLGGLLGLELLEGVECLVESESGWKRDSGVGEGLNWRQTNDGRVCECVCEKMCVCITSRSRS